MFNNKLFRRVTISVIMVMTTAPGIEAARHASAQAHRDQVAEHTGSRGNNTRKSTFKKSWKNLFKHSLFRAVQVAGLLAVLYRCIAIFKGQTPVSHYHAATPPVREEPLNPERMGVCGMCFDEKMLFPLSCHHDNYCAECLNGMLDTAIKDQSTILFKCPTPQCRNSFERDGMRLTHDRQKLEQLRYIRLQEDPAAIHCPTPDCKYAFLNNNYASHFRCPQCHMKYCARCLMNHSEKLTCRQARQTQSGDRKTHAWIKEQMDQGLIKPCPNCKMKIEKDLGCDHIHCTKCKQHFCWTCMGKSDPITHQCITPGCLRFGKVVI